jgi:hypothetical protein
MSTATGRSSESSILFFIFPSSKGEIILLRHLFERKSGKRNTGYPCYKKKKKRLLEEDENRTVLNARCETGEAWSRREKSVQEMCISCLLFWKIACDK